MKDNIVKAVKEFFKTGIMPPGVNNTVIVLIPKIKDPVQLTDFRPISLCNLIYKIVANCLVNRLRPILDEIVSPAQSAFNLFMGGSLRITRCWRLSVFTICILKGTRIIIFVLIN